MIIKVCGMREPENIREVMELGIDWMGLIFYQRSPRSIASRVIPEDITSAPTRRVGVFVNATPGYIMEMAAVHRLDYLQLHGDESPDDCHAMQKRGYSLIKALPIARKEDLERTKAYEGRVDYFLFDTKCEGYGGSGKRFDWSVLADYDGETPFLLSGGIGPHSVEAIRAFHHPRLAGIDLNSGFEIEPGHKDVNKLKEFINQIQTIRSIK